jgi:hypothetical protein
MLTLPPSVRIFAAVEPVDARKSFDGLAAVVRDSLGGDPMLCVVLRNVAARAADGWNGQVLRGWRKTIRHITPWWSPL